MEEIPPCTFILSCTFIEFRHFPSLYAYSILYDYSVPQSTMSTITYCKTIRIFKIVIISAPTSRQDMNERSANSENSKEKSHLMKLELRYNLKLRKFL